jgi:hypothetical protein
MTSTGTNRRRTDKSPGAHAAATFLAVLVVVGLVTHFLGIEAGLVVLVLGLVGPIVAPQIYHSLPPHGDATNDDDATNDEDEEINEEDDGNEDELDKPRHSDGSVR